MSTETKGHSSAECCAKPGQCQSLYPHTDHAFTVYGPTVSRSFHSAEAAHVWAAAHHRATGGTYECRDANFDHVFTIED